MTKSATPLGWDEVTESIAAWPPERRILLIHRLLNTLAAEVVPAGEGARVVRTPLEDPQPRALEAGKAYSVVGPDPRLHRTQDELDEIMARAIERLRTSDPPTDDEVRQILDDARLEKYG